MNKFGDIDLDLTNLQYQFYTMERLKSKKISEIYKNKFLYSAEKYFK